MPMWKLHISQLSMTSGPGKHQICMGMGSCCTIAFKTTSFSMYLYCDVTERFTDYEQCISDIKAWFYFHCLFKYPMYYEATILQWIVWHVIL